MRPAKCKVILPSSATERNAATFDDHRRVCKVPSTPEAWGAAVGLGRCPVRAQGSKVRFANQPPRTRLGARSSIHRRGESSCISQLRRNYAHVLADRKVDRNEDRKRRRLTRHYCAFGWCVAYQTRVRVWTFLDEPCGCREQLGRRSCGQFSVDMNRLTC
jgi:hypothetical protein